MGDEGTEGLGLLVLGSSVPGTTGLGLILSILVSGSSPVRSSVPEVVGSEDSRDDVGCLPVFFLPPALPTVPVLLATVPLELWDVRHRHSSGSQGNCLTMKSLL